MVNAAAEGAGAPDHVPDFLAVDWGTTHLRAWTVDAAGRPGPRRDFPHGVSRLGPGEAERVFREGVRPALGAERLPALLCGMIGSTLGWREAPYLDCPADAAALAGALLEVEGGDASVAIAPGLRCTRPGGGVDVMRGEEVQLMGWIAADPVRARGRRLLCHPGTHAKWVEVVDGRVARFVTAMTGELYALLSTHGVLRSDAAVAADPGDAAFEEGLAAAGDGSALSSRLFTARSRVVGGGAPAASTRAYLSGLLVGADAAACPALLGFAPDTPVALVGEPALTRLYARALERRGAAVELADGDAAVITGLTALRAAGRPSGR